MKKILLWLIGGVVGVFALLLVIGLTATKEEKKSAADAAKVGVVASNSETASPVPSSKPPAPKPSYAPDQCLDGVCIGATPGELAGLEWAKKEVISDSQLNESQRNLLDAHERAATDNCVSRNEAAWGSKAKAMCKVLALGASNSRAHEYRPIQVSKVLGYFADQSTPVCEYSHDKTPISVFGSIETPSGLLNVHYRFDENGILRVQQIFKGFNDENAETNDTLMAKLQEKHPYVTNPKAFDGSGRKGFFGEAAWGGEVRIERKEGKAPFIWLTAKPQDFDSSQLAACKQVKAVSVQ
jgi:hypothetical protein